MDYINSLSEFSVILEETFPQYYMHSNVCKFKFLYIKVLNVKSTIIFLQLYII